MYDDFREYARCFAGSSENGCWRTLEALAPFVQAAR